MSRTGAPDSALARSAASGVRWTTASGGAAAVVSLLSSLLVARFLQPAEYGLVAAALVVMGLGTAFADGGLSAAVIARKLTREELSSVYWVNIITGALMTALVVVTAPLVAGFFKEPGVTEVLLWSAPTILFTAAGAQFSQLLHRELEFRRLAFVRVVPAVLGGVVAVGSAANGAGALSIAWGMLVTAIVTSAMLAREGWRRSRPRLPPRWSDVKPHLGFGAYQMGERAVNFGASNADYVLIGRILGAAPLGIYSFAYQLVVKPVTIINPMITKVAFPLFAKRQDDDAALRRGYLHVLRSVAYTSVPPLLYLAVLAPDLVVLVLGDQWTASIPIVQILCLLGVLRCLSNPVGAVLLAKDRPDLGFKGNLAQLVLLVVALIIAVPYGIIAVAWVEVALTLLFTVIWFWVAGRLIALRLAEIARALVNPLALGFVVAGMLTLLREPLEGTSSLARLLVLTVIGALVFVVGALRVDGSWLRGMWALMRTRNPVAAPTTL